MKNNSCTEKYSIYDGCYGKVTGKFDKGILLRLDNGQEAVAYNFCSLNLGSKVLCTVIGVTKGNKLFVSVDSVVRYAYRAA